MFNKNKVGALVFLGILGSLVIGKEKSFAAMGGGGGVRFSTPKPPKPPVPLKGFYGTGSSLIKYVVKGPYGKPTGVVHGNFALLNFKDTDKILRDGIQGYVITKSVKILNSSGEVTQIQLTLKPLYPGVFPKPGLENHRLVDLKFNIAPGNVGPKTLTATFTPSSQDRTPLPKTWTGLASGPKTMSVIDLTKSSSNSQQGKPGDDTVKLGARPKVQSQGSNSLGLTGGSNPSGGIQQNNSEQVDHLRLGARPKVKNQNDSSSGKTRSKKDDKK